MLEHLPERLAALEQALATLKEAAGTHDMSWSRHLGPMTKAVEEMRAALAPVIVAAPPLAPEQIAVLREEGLLESLAALFEDMVENTFSEMRRALADGDAKALADAAHLLKGSAVNFGAAAFAATCQRIEQQAISAEPVALEALLNQLEVNYRQLREALRREIGEV